MRKINLNHNGVLVLNSGYMAIGVTSYSKALTSLFSESNGQVAAKALNIEYEMIGENEWDFNKIILMQPLSFEEWVKLPIRSFDSFIRTTNRVIRLPSIIISSYHKMPLKKQRADKKYLYNLQKGKCGYSGEPLSYSAANLEHVIPRSKGGKNTFENLMCVHKDINSKRGNRDLKDVGLVPLFRHKTPQPIPASHFIKNIGDNPDWRHFLDN